MDSDEARQLYEACIGADGVIALVDPRSILDGTWDIDYAMTTLFRFYSTNEQKRPQFVLAFTKRDETRQLVNKSITGFVRDHLPHLSRILGDGLHLAHFCSITRSGDKIALAKARAVSAPLLTVIEAIENEEAAKNRKRHFQRLRWRRAAIWCVVFLLVAFVTVASFVVGVHCRHTASNPSPQSPTPVVRP